MERPKGGGKGREYRGRCRRQGIGPFLNLAWRFQMNSTRSPDRLLGETPRRRAKANLNSACPEGSEAS